MKSTSRLAAICGVCGLFVSSAASAVGVPFTQMFTATSTTANEIAMDFGSTYKYAIFDSNDLGSLSNPLIMDNGATPNGQDTIGVGEVGSSTVLLSSDNHSETLILSDTTFFFGISTDGGSTWSPWLYDLSLGSEDVWNFDFQANGTGSMDLIMVDIAPVGPPQEIPIPAAVWLFGSGLLGLVGVARHKK
jgi:hypothetical protein